jgi:hypothetical protein
VRDDGDFAAYAAARWPSMVRTLVLLGVAPDRAPYVVRTALGRLRGDWRRRDELGDLDGHAYRVLLETRGDGRVLGSATATPGGLAPTDPDWPALERRLDGLTPAERAAVVLSVTAGLAPDQVEEVLDGATVLAPPDLREPLLRAASSVPVPQFALAEVLARQQADRREHRVRTARRAGAAALVVALVAGGWTWWATRPGPPAGLPDAEVERVGNPATVGWYTDDTLRLDRVALSIDDLQRFTQLPQGAVYADSVGEVVLVDLDGHRIRLGTQVPNGVFAASAQDGLVAWVDVSGSPELRVYDLATDEVVATTSVEEATRVVAIDDGLVYVAGSDGAYVFEFDGDGWTALARVDPDGLLDVAGGATAFQADPQTVDVVHQDSALGVSVAGVGAQLAPEAGYVLTRGGGPDGPVRIFDTFTGKEIDTGLAPDAQVSAAKLGGRGLATYLVELAQDDPVDGPRLSNSGSLQLVTCPLGPPGRRSTCSVHLTFPKSTSWTLEQ